LGVEVCNNQKVVVWCWKAAQVLISCKALITTRKRKRQAILLDSEQVLQHTKGKIHANLIESMNSHASLTTISSTAAQ
jgi:hypothetical protein